MTNEIQSIDVNKVKKSGLPAWVFRDSDVYESERKSLYREGWVSIASAQQLKQSGDIFPVHVAGNPLIVVRGKDNEIRVFHNVCRHKSAPLVDIEGGCNRASVLVCPYHKWSYKLDGQLLAAPCYYGDQETVISNDDKAGMGLLPVRFKIWWDTVFVNISGDAEDFEAFIKPLDDYLHEYDENAIELVSATDYKGNANWKLMVDNFLDGYHVPFVHSQACKIESMLDQESLLLSDNIVGIRLAQGTANKLAKTSKPMPHFSGLKGTRKNTQQWFCLFPNTLFFVDPCWVQTIVIKPQSVSCSTETLAVYTVHPDAAHDDFEEDRFSLQQVLNGVNKQDVALLEKLQINRSSEAANSGNLVSAWDEVGSTFQQLWLKKMLEKTNPVNTN